VKKIPIVVVVLFALSFVAMATEFESKVLSDYGGYVKVFNSYISTLEETGRLDVNPTTPLQHVVYTIVSDLEPVAYYRWIRMRSFQIPSGAVGNFQNIDMQYISKNIYERYKSNDPVENISLSAFLVYAVGTLYREKVGQTDFPKSPTFTEAVFSLTTLVSKDAADVARAYLQKSIGAKGKVPGNYSYKKVDLKGLLSSSLAKYYDGKLPADLSNAVQKTDFEVDPVDKLSVQKSISPLILQSLAQGDIDKAADEFQSRVSKSVNNAAKMVRLFISTGQSTSMAVEKSFSSLKSSLKIQELLAANTVKSSVSRKFNNRITKLENGLASHGSSGNLLFWRWLIYAVLLLFFAFYKPRILKYILFSILAFEGIVILFGVDPMLNRFDSTMYGFLIVMTAFFSTLSWVGILSTKKLFPIVSSSVVLVLFVSMFFVPLYSNLPSTRMSQNNAFLNSSYMKMYEDELYGENGILTYHLRSLNSDLISLRLEPYNFTSQTLSSYLSSIKKSGAYKGVFVYPAALRINVNRNSPYFGYSNVATNVNSIRIVQERAKSALRDIQDYLNLAEARKGMFAQTLDSVYTLSAPALRSEIKSHVEKQVASSNLKEISKSIDGVVRKADMAPEKAPNVHFFQTREGSKLFILVSLLLISVTFFRRNWIYRFTFSIITAIGALMLLAPKAVEVFVEYGFPTYSHILQNGEGPNDAMILIVVIVSLFVTFEALYTRLFGKKSRKKEEGKA